MSVSNAAVDGAPFNGWFVGDFTRWLAERSASSSKLAAVGLRDTTLLEVKWGIHPAGQPRPAGWAEQSPAVEHRWYAIQDSIILTVRWPVPA